MSKWTKEQIDEFWRQPHGHGVLGAVFADRLRLAEEEFLEARAHLIAEALERDREAETRARKAEKLSRFVEAEMQTSSSTPLDGYALELSKIEAEIQEATKRQHASLGTMFRADPSVPPGYVLPRDAWEQFVAESALAPPPPYTPCGVTRSAGTGLGLLFNHDATSGAKGAAARAERAMQLADECGALKTENRVLLVENARLRRRIEDMERKGKR